MTYEFTAGAPKKPTNEAYIKKATAEFQKLLENCSNDETEFQSFFEQNPHFVPGSRDELSSIGDAGHEPHFLCLITQPKISGLINRQPDFMWLANDSVYFSPVIIEIEAPAKKHFNKNGSPSANFNQAVHQLQEWQTILSRPENILKFYEDFSIPQDLRDLTFNPHFALVYGRRSEFKEDKLLKMKRGNLLAHNQSLQTYDRISPKYMDNNFVCCTVKDGRYFAKYVSPLFHIGPYEDNFLYIHDLDNAVQSSKSISIKRRQFLAKKLPVWLEFLKKEKDGLKVKIKKGDNLQMDE